MIRRISGIILTFLLMCTLVLGENPLEGYVDEESFKSGEKIFQTGEINIFKESPAMNKANTEARVRGQFPQVVSVVNKGGIWNGIFYFVDSGKRSRKTIKGSGVVKGEEVTYAVSIFGEGIRVRDVVSGITAEIKTKRR